VSAAPAALKPLVIGVAGFFVGGLLFYLAYDWGSLVPVAFIFGVALAMVAGIAVFPAVRVRLIAVAKKLSWWHGLWFLTYFGGLVFREGRDLQSVESIPVDAVALLRVVPELIVAAVLLLRLAMKRPAWLGSFFRGVVGALGVYGLVCLTSSLWSVYPPWTFYKSGEYLISVALLAAILLSAQSTDVFASLMNLTWTIFLIELGWGWIQTLIWPADAWDQWNRITSVVPLISANGMGYTAAVVSTIAICRLLPLERGRVNRLLYSLVLLLGVATMIMSKTRNAIAGFILAFALLIAFSRRWRLGLVFGALTLPVLAFTGAGGSIFEFLARGQSEKEIVSLSSRMDWWTFAWHQFMQHPFTGLGAYAGSRFAVLGKLGVDAGSLHSDYVETIMGTSFWGLIPLLVAIIGTWWLLVRFVRSQSLQPAERQFAYECACVLGLTTLHSFFNVEIVWQAPLTFLCILGYAEFMRRKQLGVTPALSRAAAIGAYQ
jgi:O-antigen ligase